jgi:hypothetical protein
MWRRSEEKIRKSDTTIKIDFCTKMKINGAKWM